MIAPTGHDRDENITRDRTIAVVGPTFFSYIKTIADALRGRGFRVVEFDEKFSNHNAAKIMFRIGLAFAWLSPQKKYLRSLAATIAEQGSTDVFLIGVEVINREFVELLRQRNIRVHLYMWDGRKNKGGFQRYLDLLDGKSTFDIRDSTDLGMEYVPLFAEPTFATGDNRHQRKIDIGFCGTMHSDRVRIISDLVERSKDHRITLGLMLYYHSRRLFALKTWSAPRGRILLDQISDRSFPKEQVAALSRDSKYVLDIPHPGQTGLTARTFEALRAGARLVTYNQAAAEHLPAAIRDRVTIVSDGDDLLALDFAAAPLRPLSDEESYYLSLERFIDQLLALMGAGPAAEMRADDRVEGQEPVVS